MDKNDTMERSNSPDDIIEVVSDTHTSDEESKESDRNLRITPMFKPGIIDARLLQRPSREALGVSSSKLRSPFIDNRPERVSYSKVIVVEFDQDGGEVDLPIEKTEDESIVEFHARVEARYIVAQMRHKDNVSHICPRELTYEISPREKRKSGRPRKSTEQKIQTADGTMAMLYDDYGYTELEARSAEGDRGEMGMRAIDSENLLTPGTSEARARGAQESSKRARYNSSGKRKRPSDSDNEPSQPEPSDTPM